MSTELEGKLEQDHRYKTYASNVSKCLKASEHAREWADLISFLGRLNKVIATAPEQFTVVPHRHLLAKRLAQCLNPSLPGGVHLKAIEVYALVFQRLGPIQLREELYLYTVGLYPLFNTAFINVKEALLDLYERHFLPLDAGLEPGLKGLILALLPGLEEGSEFFSRTMELLNNVCKRVDARMFFGHVWGSLLTTPSLRFFAATYLAHRLKAAGQIDDHKYVLGRDADLVAGAIAAGLSDANNLVARTVLEILVTYLPLHSAHLGTSQLARVMPPALRVVLKRDMSLNRRLYTWLVGPDNVGGDEYFQRHARNLVVPCLVSEFDALDTRTASRTEALVPFKTLVVLVEKPEVGQHVVRAVLIPVMRCLWRALAARPGYVAELYRAATQFFSLLDPAIVFTHLAERIRVLDASPFDDHDGDIVVGDGLGPASSVYVGAVDGLELLDFALEVVEFKQEATHTPAAVALPELLNLLVDRVAPHMDVLPYTPHLAKVNEVLQRLVLTIDAHALSVADTARLCTASRYHEYAGHVINSRVLGDLHAGRDACGASTFLGTACEVMHSIAETLGAAGVYTPGPHVTAGEDMDGASIELEEGKRVAQTRLRNVIDALLLCLDVNMWQPVVMTTRTIISMLILAPVMAAGLESFFSNTARKLWDWLGPEHALTEEQAGELVATYLSLHLLAKSSVCEDVICNDLGSPNPQVRVKACIRFSSMWRVSGGLLDEDAGRVFFRRATLLMLGLLDDTDTAVQLQARAWFSTSLVDLPMMLDAIFDILLHPTMRRRPAGRVAGMQRQVSLHYIRTHDSTMCEYALAMVRRALHVGAAAFVQVCHGLCVPDAISNSPGDAAFQADSYFDLLVANLLWILQSDAHELSERNGPFAHRRTSNYNLQVVATQLLQDLFDMSQRPLPSKQYQCGPCAYIGPMLVGLYTVPGRSPNPSPILKARTKPEQNGADLSTGASALTVPGPHEAGFRDLGALRLAEVERVALGRLAAAVTPDQKELQVALLRLVHGLVVLEHLQQRHDNGGKTSAALRHRILDNPMYLDTILIALNMPNLRTVHVYWMTYVLSSLPYMGAGLGMLLLPVTRCLALALAQMAHMGLGLTPSDDPVNAAVQVEHATAVLEGLLAILNYISERPAKGKGHDDVCLEAKPTEASPEVGGGQMLANLINIFGAEQLNEPASTSSPVIEARNAILGSFHEVLEPLASVWVVIAKARAHPADTGPMPGHGHTSRIPAELRRGTSRDRPKSADVSVSLTRGVDIQQRTLDILRLVFDRHPARLVDSLLVVWQGLDDPRLTADTWDGNSLLDSFSPEQNNMLDMMCAVFGDHVDTVVGCIQAKFQHNHSMAAQASAPAAALQDDTTMTQFLYGYLRATSSKRIGRAWGSTLTLMKGVAEGSTHPPTVVHMLGCVWVLTLKTDKITDPKIRRRLQDGVVRLSMTLATAAVLPIVDGVMGSPRAGTGDAPGNKSMARGRVQAVQAVHAMRTCLMNLLDAVHGKDEKDRAASVLINILAVLSPSMKAGQCPAEFYGEALGFIARVSEYNYTLRAWRREVFDQLLDQTFFRMNSTLISRWRRLVEHLFTYDRGLLQDLMEQLGSLGTSSGLNLFTTARQEMELRGRLLKRIAFALYCCKKNEHQHEVPAIMERIVDSLKVANGQHVAVRVFLLLRVLLLRVSEDSFAAWWPALLSESIGVLQRSVDVVGSGAELPLPDLAVLLSVCKFIDMLALLPIEQFHFHQYTFFDDKVSITDGPSTPAPSGGGGLAVFVPFFRRLAARGPAQTVPPLQSFEGKRGPLLTMKEITCIDHLQPFFATMADFHYLSDVAQASIDMEAVEGLMDNEFLETGSEGPLDGSNW